MRFVIMSDCHQEFFKNSEKLSRSLPSLPPEDEYDAVLLPGDIGLGTKGIEWAAEFFPEDKPVLFCQGNHEYYKQLGGIKVTDARIERAASGTHISVLNPGSRTFDDVVIIGAPLWTDLKLKGYDPVLNPPERILNAITDSRLIVDLEGNYFNAKQCVALYDAHRAFIRSELEAIRDRADRKEVKTVVMTHFVPSQLCIDPAYKTGPTASLNPYFTNDCDDLMEEFKIDLWVYGHTHSRLDIVHPSGTRLVGNPVGYPGENPGFKWKILEV